jgi:hypothetical protein
LKACMAPALFIQPQKDDEKTMVLRMQQKA